ncbi:MAG TPA: DUF4962 domain-containing protein [Bryobacteraceae bacterium]|nr:DUF4962 domain-containing protein [Bryobacteraceae bacterium]HPT26589.1 DUF4962 domain-containing protein [Bryobacteraceae bacterium]
MSRIVGFFVVASLVGLSGDLSGAVWTTSLPVTERPAHPEELIAYPPDAAAAGVNPPGFTWTPADGAKAYRLELRRRGNSALLLSTSPLSSTVYPHGAALPAGEYEWQVVYLDGAGKPLGVSKSRRFSLAATTPKLPMPDVALMRRQLAGKRPRMFLTGTRIAEIKQAVAAGNVSWWKTFIATADAAVAEASYPEPAGYPSAVFSVDHWRRIYTPGKRGSAHVARTALAWKLTGDPKYLAAAKRWMLTLASWDPRGVTSHDIRQPNGSDGNDEASMPMLERMSFAWDWIGDEFTPEERAKVLASMTERGNQVLLHLQKEEFLSFPFPNHSGRVLAFLGDAGLSFLGDIPDAEKWLDYVLRCYLTSYPGWGGDQGGWAQGMSYWSGYVYFLTSFAEALRGATDVDLFRRPFYRNTGYLAVYFQPPYAPRGAFGDGGERPSSDGQQVLVERFAEAFDDPVLRWRAQAMASATCCGFPPQTAAAPSTATGTDWREWQIEDVGAVLQAKAGPPRPVKPPVDLDGSRHFADIGWVAMHSALGKEQDDVWALFKSSRFGSFSHSHGDQNTFQLNAYGRALLIDSGYYPWYGSPHHALWYRQTHAHNGVLVNGRGQPPYSWEANGNIEAYERKGPVTLVRGQAANAYNQPQEPGTQNLWKQHRKDPIPPMEPKLESFERTMVFVSSKTRPVIFISDYLRSAAPATYDWLLHALSKMGVEDDSGIIRVKDGPARLVVRIISSAPVRFSQTDQFSVLPVRGDTPDTAETEEQRKARFPDQWHLTAKTQEPAREARFLAVMVPYRETEAEPVIELMEGQDARGFVVDGVKVAAWWGAGERGRIQLKGLSGEGRTVVQATQDGTAHIVIGQ